MTSIRSFWLRALTIALLADVGLTAQIPKPYALTPETLAQAIAEDENSAPAGLPILAGRVNRVASSTLADDFGDVVARYENAPYDVYVLTPFVRAASTAADAKRRFLPAPALTADG